jgi:hypothetical protein
MKNDYKNILEKLIKDIPEFKNYENYIAECDINNKGNQYVVFGVLQSFFKEAFKEKRTKVVKSISKFLEEACSTDDDKLIELVMFGFMETLYGNNGDFNKDMLDYFGDNTKKILVKTIKHNSKIGTEDKDKVYKLFGDKLE